MILVILLILGIFCDVVGRIGCWLLARRTAGGSQFGWSVGSQVLAVHVFAYQTMFGWLPWTVQATLVVAAIVAAQVFAALRFTNGIRYLAKQHGWPKLEQQASQLTDNVQATLVTGVVVVLFMGFFLIILFLPFFTLYHVLLVGLIGLLAMRCLRVELYYLSMMWRLVAASRRSHRNVIDKPS